ncbi:class I SAM-dependent methyltransferase [Gammaproteobacteria bacterium]|nr:class I SAM-dependent methyltransferase [Gammaproteobacteria bacterium]
MSESSQRWLKAQEIEPTSWNENIDVLYSEQYREKIKDRSMELQSFLSNHIDLLKPDLKILEVGGGGSPLIDHFPSGEKNAADPLQDFYNDTFSFISEEVITKSSKAEDLDYPDDYFDILITRNCIDHVDSLDKTLEQFNRITKANGKIYIGCNVFSGLLFLIRTIYKDPEHPYTFSHNSLTRILESKGMKLNEIRIDDQEQMLHFGEMESKDFIRSTIRNFFISLNSYHVSEFIISPNKE